MEPKIIDRDAIRLIGLEQAYDQDNKQSIPELWQRLQERLGEIPGQRSGVAYGVCETQDPDEGRFLYMAGVEVDSLETVPHGMVGKTLPAQRYAVFTHSGHISDLPKTVYTIWNKGLPDAGLEPAKAPDFEVYDRRFDPETGRGVVEVWIPVA